VTRKRSGAGFTLLELVVVICLVAIFASVALDRFLRYQEIAEKAAMEATVGAMRSAAALQASARILHGGLDSVLLLADENPIEWLATPPPGYRGALYEAGTAGIPRGSWFFDLQKKELVYLPQRTKFFTPAPDGRLEVHYKVIVKISKGEPRTAANALSELDVRLTSPLSWAPEF